MEELRLSRGQDWLHEWRGIVESKDIAQDQTQSSEDNRLPDDVFKDKAKDAVGGEGDAVSTGGGQPEGLWSKYCLICSNSIPTFRCC